MVARHLIWMLALSLTSAFGVTQATVRLDGHFIANEDCPALTSIKKNKNPGNVRLIRRLAYKVIGKNKTEATHYLLRIEEASPMDRWVARSCGVLLLDCRRVDGAEEPPEPTSPEYVLAATWQASFCQTNQHKPECESQTPDRYDAANFSLHGLWPQSQASVYCGVSNFHKQLDRNRAWSQLPALPLTDDTRFDLAVAMPGLASHLHRHEWIKHGTCYGGTPEDYYRDSLLLMDQLNDSPVAELFSTHVGQELTAVQILNAFEQSFGPGAGSKVEIKCEDGMISELRVNLKGEIHPGVTLEELIGSAPETEPGCGGGRVDAVGF
jgi:ribonuclease T2